MCNEFIQDRVSGVVCDCNPIYNTKQENYGLSFWIPDYKSDTYVQVDYK